MIDSEETTLVNMICPYCKESFRKQVEYQKKTGLFTILIKNHPNSHECPPFIAFIDNNGRHRGSQKIDNVDEEDNEESISGQFLENARFHFPKGFSDFLALTNGPWPRSRSDKGKPVLTD